MYRVLRGLRFLSTVDPADAISGMHPARRVFLPPVAASSIAPSRVPLLLPRKEVTAIEIVLDRRGRDDTIVALHARDAIVGLSAACWFFTRETRSRPRGAKREENRDLRLRLRGWFALRRLSCALPSPRVRPILRRANTRASYPRESSTSCRRFHSKVIFCASPHNRARQGRAVTAAARMILSRSCGWPRFAFCVGLRI